MGQGLGDGGRGIHEMVERFTTGQVASEGTRTRLEQRVTTLLLPTLPASMKSDLIATRQLHVGGILFAVRKRYQPGEHAEKQATLAALTSTTAARDAQEAVTMLRLWERRVFCIQELGSTLPDPILQVKSLDGIMAKVLEGAPQAAFRANAYRMAKEVGSSPNQHTISHLHDMLLAEAEQLMYLTSAEKTSTAVRSMDGKAKGGKGGGLSSPGKGAHQMQRMVVRRKSHASSLPWRRVVS